MKRFPASTEEDLRKAHAYVYGGSLVPDMGYSPFSSHFMSDLLHYVRPGDFVEALIAESKTLNEYAFALGALAHFASDTSGHPSINRITVVVYPKLRAKFPNGVAYDDAPAQHLKTEFALDVVQVARGLYAPDAYHDFIGFEIDQALLERTFLNVYGLPFKDLFLSEDLVLGTFRYGVGNLIPKLTRVAWQSKRDDIEKLTPGVTRARFTYALPRRTYEKEWGTTYKHPGVSERILAFLFHLIPTAGPFKALGFHPIPANAERMFLASFDTTVARYHTLLDQVAANQLELEDINLDTGLPIRPGEYHLTDETHVELLHHLADRNFDNLPPELSASLQAYLKDPSHLSEKTRKHLVPKDLDRLLAIPKQ